MPAAPTRYGPTQYPQQYRPLGYGLAGDAAAPDSDRLAGSPRSRRRWWWLAAALLLATIVAHGVIAATYLDDRAASSSASSPDVSPGESCDPIDDGSGGGAVPDLDTPQDEGGAGGGTGQSDTLRRRL